MLSCTEAGDTGRINSIIARLTEINTREILSKVEPHREIGECSDWQAEVPKNDGDFYYSGPTPEGKEVVAIVGIVTIEGERQAYVYLPPNWRGDEAERGTLHYGLVADWKGEWSGPDHGLCCCVRENEKRHPVGDTAGGEHNQTP